MMRKIYLIKNLSPWMVTELLAFSLYTPFRLILLRKPADIYGKDIDKLREKGIEVFITPFQSLPDFNKFIFSLKFFLQNFPCFVGIKNFAFGIKAIYWFNKLKDDIIPSGGSIHAQFATQSAIIAFMYKNYSKKVEYVFTFHAHDIFYKNRWLTSLINNSKLSFSISEYNIKYVSFNYPKVNIQKVILSRLGVFIPYPVGTKKRNVFSIGFLSWWEEKKGLMILINSFYNLVNDRNLKMHLVLAGDGPLRQHVEEYIVKDKLSSFIEYRGKIYGKEKEKFYKDIDVFILPAIPIKNDMDGIPVVLMEAIRYGIPIISTNISGIPEICIDNYNGFLINPNDIESLTNAILKFYNMDKQKYEEFRQNAFEMSKKYDIVKNSEIKLKKMGWICNL